jgi:hypothetical protein
VESSCERGNEPCGFHKMLGNYRVTAQVEGSRVALCSTELVEFNVYNEFSFNFAYPARYNIFAYHFGYAHLRLKTTSLQQQISPNFWKILAMNATHNHYRLNVTKLGWTVMMLLSTPSLPPKPHYVWQHSPYSPLHPPY